MHHGGMAFTHVRGRVATTHPFAAYGGIEDLNYRIDLVAIAGTLAANKTITHIADELKAIREILQLDAAKTE